MKIVCMYCNREKVTAGKRGDASDGKISHGVCARCILSHQNVDLAKDGDLLFMKNEIKSELDNQVEWDGDSPLSAEFEKEFIRLVDMVKAERGEGGDGSRK